MPLRFGRRVFAPRPAGTLATLVLLPCLIGLGLWQMERAAEKRALLDEFARGAHDLRVVTSRGELDDEPRYQRIRITGHYEPDRQVLLDNMPSASGQPGYQVLTPFVVDAGSWIVLVDRGWVPLGPTRADLPEISVDRSLRSVTGRLDTVPEPGIRLGDARRPGIVRWPQVLNYPTEEDLTALYGPGLDPRILLLDADEPNGFERIWHGRFGFGPERHLGYAIQWFALAVTLVVIYVAVNTKQLADSGEKA